MLMPPAVTQNLHLKRIPTEEKPGSSSTKALAQLRAVFGSSREHRQVKGRKLTNTGVSFPRSRLSQVSLCEDSTK